MAQPTPYNRVFSFTNDQTANPSTKTPGNQLDAEYNAILITMTQILANLALIQRDDGQLANSSVGFNQLKAEVSSGLAPATTWATSQSYLVNSTVFNGMQLYRCLVSHISGTFATDLAAGKWLLLADFTTAITAGVLSIGNQGGNFTINGGNLSSAVLPIARYDAAQTLTSGQQLQLANNQLVPSAAGAQTLTATQQNQAQNNLGLPSVMRSYLAGLTLSTAGSSATFSVAAGVAADSTNVDMMTLSASINKTTSSWAVGSGNGALDTGAIANSTWYHVWLIKRTDTQVVDVLVSLSATTPTMPTSYTEKRRIGAMKTNGSAQWTQFVQVGDTFLWTTAINDINSVNTGTTPTLYTLTVPTGVNFTALFRGGFINTVGAGGTLQYMSPLGGTSIVAVASLVAPAANVAAEAEFQVITNTSAQIYLVNNGAANNQNFVTTYGWIDTRGRLS